ncbi:ATP-grasp domain-containing protein [Thiohalorhabdus sp. Cl-TMA]|uniref:ATP-grasp domain-containing protein n=1 Tax=Thiohalorhabdus methylotrophus TaxID=3242694 RepID=A0ABV4TV25_9GAMM
MPTPELIEEGRAMVAALVADLAAIPEVEPQVAWDFRLAMPDLPAEVLRTVPGERRDHFWDRAMNGCGAVWPIAPESGGELERVSRMVLEEDRVLLGCRPEAVRLAASKRDTARILEEAGIPVATTRAADEPLPESEHGWVLKPDQGEGGLDVQRFPSRAGIEGARARLADPENWVVQPFIPGRACSLSLLMDGVRGRMISKNHQHVSFRPGDACLDAVLPGPPPEGAAPWSELISAMARGFPGLWGYVGMDFVETPEGPVVLEINPRLTTAYAGLDRQVVGNPAREILRTAGLVPGGGHATRQRAANDP